MTRSFIIAVLVSAFSFILLAGSVSAQAMLAPGQRGEEIKALQEILSQDRTIYPEGLATGYYGKLTKRAVQRLQKKCGLPGTGIIDEKTSKCIFPERYKITVQVPNGGEEWDRAQLHQIQWGVEKLESKEGKEEFVPRYVFWKKASIDLYRRMNIPQPKKPCISGEECPSSSKQTSVFVRHLATVNLFDNAWTWRITNDIPNGSNYVIRISTGGRSILPLYMRAKRTSVVKPKLWPIPSPSWDESDGPFTITGESVVPPSPAPELKKVLAILEEISEKLLKAIELLKAVIAR